MQKLFTLYDIKSETYTAPTVNPTRAQAIRSFGDAVNNKNQPSVLTDHPEDFTLFEIGEFDIRTGQITLYEAKFPVANGLDVKEPDAITRSN